jgi:hypothetical protein
MDSSFFSTRTSWPSGRDLTISKNFFPLTVMAPGSSMVAPTRVLSPTSRSVPVSSISESETFIRMLARMGIVFRFSTIPWRSCNSSSRVSLRSENFMTPPFYPVFFLFFIFIS